MKTVANIWCATDSEKQINDSLYSSLSRTTSSNSSETVTFEVGLNVHKMNGLYFNLLLVIVRYLIEEQFRSLKEFERFFFFLFLQLKRELASYF